MANYTTADIRELREKTGAGMMDVKKALDDADGDMEKALEIIRVKGLKGAAKREGRSASEGLVAADVRAADGEQVGTLVEVNCETDFVAKNQKFIDLGDEAVKVAADSGASTPEELKETGFDIVEKAAAMGEKILVRRIGRVSGEHVDVYLHRTSPDLPPQVGVLVATDAKGAEVAHDVALHIAAYSPLYLTRDEISAETIESERHIAEETARNEGKPEKVLPKIVDGRMNGFYKENVLLDQPFARDPKKSVGQIISASGGTVTGYVRFRVGS
ncbi:MAG TPA: translation elongation factor Ts [Actinomycetaceae bacterium]|nr:translation elongation factor Ts [Actinomycetaceae bacterium]